MQRNIHLEKQRAAAFNDASEHYRQHRPGYPEAVRDTIITRTGLRPGADLLEIGVGPGQASRLFVDRGYRIVGVEPGDRLRDTALADLGHPRDFTIEPGTFETWDPAGRRFDLAYAGSAFHWVDPAIGFPKLARCLRPGGSIALFWSMFPSPDLPIWRELRQVYERETPQIVTDRFNRSFEVDIEDRRQSIASSGQFVDLTVDRLPWSLTLTADQYLGLIMTYSDHITLPPPQQTRLLAGIREVVTNHGGTIERPWVTVLYCARKPS